MSPAQFSEKPRGVGAIPWRRVLVLLCLLSVFVGFLPICARAQSYVYQIGKPTFTTALPVENGFINVANGNLHLEIPLGNFPQRGGRSLSGRLVYDSRIWEPIQGSWQPVSVPGNLGGWRYETNVDGGSVSFLTGTHGCRVINQLDSWTSYSDFQWPRIVRGSWCAYLDTGNEREDHCALILATEILVMVSMVLKPTTSLHFRPANSFILTADCFAQRIPQHMIPSRCPARTLAARAKRLLQKFLLTREWLSLGLRGCGRSLN